jgi:hypothetical protein
MLGNETGQDELSPTPVVLEGYAACAATACEPGFVLNAGRCE